jgi:hypothetical protein
MTYEVLDVEHGDVLAAYDSLEMAKERVAGFVEAHPERGDDLAIAAIDEDTGEAVGELIMAASIADPAHA